MSDLRCMLEDKLRKAEAAADLYAASVGLNDEDKDALAWHSGRVSAFRWMLEMIPVGISEALGKLQP
jgi:hypothetical protein